jgi:putative heme iron utilization protein
MDGMEARDRLERSTHGALGTVHAERGVDLVPVVFAVVDDLVGIPVDTVKPKAATTLQRERNLALDPRATLLVEHWDPADWTRLWWVRASLRAEAPSAGAEAMFAERLAAANPQYREHPFTRILMLRVVEVSGWSAEP